MVTLAYVWTSKFQIFYFSQIVSYALQTSPEPSQTLHNRKINPHDGKIVVEAVDHGVEAVDVVAGGDSVDSVTDPVDDVDEDAGDNGVEVYHPCLEVEDV